MLDYWRGWICIKKIVSLKLREKRRVSVHLCYKTEYSGANNTMCYCRLWLPLTHGWAVSLTSTSPQTRMDGLERQWALCLSQMSVNQEKLQQSQWDYCTIKWMGEQDTASCLQRTKRHFKATLLIQRFLLLIWDHLKIFFFCSSLPPSVTAWHLTYFLALNGPKSDLASLKLHLLIICHWANLCLRGAPSPAPAATSPHWRSRCGLKPASAAHKKRSVPCPLHSRKVREWQRALPCPGCPYQTLCCAGFTGAAGRRNNAGISVKSMEWQEGSDTNGISSAVSKEKSHFLINDILGKGNRQERQRRGHISAWFWASRRVSCIERCCTEEKGPLYFLLIILHVHPSAACSTGTGWHQECILTFKSSLNQDTKPFIKIWANSTRGS